MRCRVPDGQRVYTCVYDEARSFAALAAVMDAAGLRAERRHVEIYLGDPRSTNPDKLKTVLLKEVVAGGAPVRAGRATRQRRRV